MSDTVVEKETPSINTELLGRPARPGRALKVAIAGGGVGGLTTALCMLKKGFDVTVYEKTAAFARFGGPIQFASNALSVIKEIDVINYKSGLGMIFAARPIQTSSTNYWLFEYIRRRIEDSNNEVMFECLVLGCVDYDRFQYAIYVYELG